MRQGKDDEDAVKSQPWRDQETFHPGALRVFFQEAVEALSGAQRRRPNLNDTHRVYNSRFASFGITPIGHSG